MWPGPVLALAICRPWQSGCPDKPDWQRNIHLFCRNVNLTRRDSGPSAGRSLKMFKASVPKFTITGTPDFLRVKCVFIFLIREPGRVCPVTLTDSGQVRPR